MTRRTELRDILVEVLSATSDLTAREIVALLPERGYRAADRSKVNGILYSNSKSFANDGHTPPRWSLKDGRGTPKPLDPKPPAEPWLPSLRLYPWQDRALDGWASAGYRGVIEAVTGAGKTRLALAAIAAEMARGGRVVAIVPNLDLLRQWHAQVSWWLVERGGMPLRIGRLGGGVTDSLTDCDILIATAHSASQKRLGLPSRGGLLIADEVHHYGAEQWSKVLDGGFDRRLGLTATYERDDGTVELVLDPYFGPYRYQLGYVEALDEEVIAHFKVAFVGVRFAGRELEEYEAQDARARKRRKVLIGQHGLSPQPFGLFMREVQQLSRASGEGAKQARLYLTAFSKRRQLLARAVEKLSMLRRLAPAIKAAERTIVFTQTVEAAEEAQRRARRAGIPSGVLHAELDPTERTEVFERFRDGGFDLVAAPMLLDEGVDVPDADLAIVVASSRSRRQMVQRMGRIVRRKADGRRARLAILYVEGTSEDPASGAHEDFIQFVIDAADETRVFGADADVKVVNRFLADR